jgi:membrane-bound ClpP family serine protease
MIIPIDIYPTTTVHIDGYLTKYDIPKFSNVLENEKKDLFIILNSSGGKIDTIFKIVDNIIKIKKKGIKVYSLIQNDSVAFAGAFFIVLLSDIVFYTNSLNLGVFTPLSKNIYKSRKNDFDKIFKEIDSENDETSKNIFLNGEMFKPDLLDKINTKFIRIESLEDIEFSVDSYKDINFNNKMWFISYLYTPNFIFFIFNLTIILIFSSVYFTKNIFLSILSILFLSAFIFLSFEITLSLKAIFAIFFTHFMLIFKEYIKLKYILFVLSFSVFILSSIYFTDPLNSNYYIDTGFRVDIVVILITIISIILMYKILILFFNKRFGKFNKSRNELKYQEAIVTSTYPLLINILGDEFPAISINKLHIDNKVKIIGFRGIKVIIERIN